MKEHHCNTLIIGAGPAGLTAGHALGKAGRHVTVLEKDGIVGGIARTETHDGYAFDIGGHRFFTKVDVINDLWKELLPPEDWISCKRLSRIYYHKTFFYYPLRLGNVLTGLGPWNSFLILMSYLRARIVPHPKEETFEEWVVNRFGQRLYATFFRSYTEKVWGIPCSEIQADWAAQRIQGLSFVSVIKNALLGSVAVNSKRQIKTLIDSFEYPRLGPGMLWGRTAEKIKELGGEVRLNTSVERIQMDGNRVVAVETNGGGTRERWTADHFISSMPLRDWVEALSPPPPPEVLQAAKNLKYRDFLTVALMINRAEIFPDNWIYIHDPDVKVGRVQNFKNWSPEMVPDPDKTCLGLEYFCFEGDGLWSMDDEALVALAGRELAEINLVRESEIEGGVVIRMPKAYPVYDNLYAESVRVLRAYMESLSNAQTVGRNGMHRYNNQDHSMLTALMAAHNVGGETHNPWEVNLESDYHENKGPGDAAREKLYRDLASTQPPVPKRKETRKEE